MVEVRCLIVFALSTFLALGCVSAFHPMAHLSQSEPEGDTTSESSSDEDNAIDNFISEGDIPLQELERTFMRLGEQAEKRGQNRNFLRFGKSSGGNPLTSSLYIPTESEEKRASQSFVRFGRNPTRNFLRFGKSSPLSFGLGLEGDSSEEMMKRGNNKNFLRFGKAANRNFLRFGRSTESQMKENCDDCATNEIQSSSVPPQSSSQSRKRGNALSKQVRSKRSVSAFYDDAEFVPHTALSWSSQYGPQSALDDASGPGEQTNNGQKRSHSRSFVRYGRDPLDLHFLRFGKRGSTEDAKVPSDADEDSFSRYVRARSSKNFLRFG